MKEKEPAFIIPAAGSCQILTVSGKMVTHW
jgi:hypothetical protein